MTAPGPVPDPMDTYAAVAAEFNATLTKLSDNLALLAAVIREATGQQIPAGQMLAAFIPPARETGATG